ncbi:DNA replication complex GINS protein-like protein psf3 [Tricladium varicosporioides]|nr:DNA replication complex GINS protein-like protein psf3 [Hymenoscyphus varicosporioides]
MSYYDVDAILTDAQKVPITILVDMPNLGYLDNNPGHTLKAGTKLSLPLWIAEYLATSQTTAPLFDLEVAPSLKPRVLNALKASPKSVDLRGQAQYFYGLGARTLELWDDHEICDVLTETWRTRAGEVSDCAVNAGHKGGAAKGNSTGGGIGGGGDVEFLRGLDEDERNLFRAQHDSSKTMRIWMEQVGKS